MIFSLFTSHAYGNIHFQCLWMSATEKGKSERRYLIIPRWPFFIYHWPQPIKNMHQTIVVVIMQIAANRNEEKKIRREWNERNIWNCWYYTHSNSAWHKHTQTIQGSKITEWMNSLRIDIVTIWRYPLCNVEENGHRSTSLNTGWGWLHFP